MNNSKNKVLKVKTEKARAWKAFSEYIRKAYQAYYQSGGNLLVECYTCGIKKPYKEMQAGHGIPGRNNAVLFLEEVVKPQCVGCNVFGRGKYPIFTSKLIKELGMEEYDRVLNLSQQVVKFTALDYRDRYEYYKAKSEDIK